MSVAPLLAPSGVTMRVVSQAASFTWGSWSVTWPEDFEEPDPPGEDRELGWIADLGGDEVEPFGRCFVRADAQIDARIGRSNVEDVLDAARFRTSGEVFLEAQIPNENLAGQLPYRDFGVNSFVPVRVGGRILEGQLVTRVEESEDELGHRAVSVFVGGQKFQDREALRTQNRELDRVIAQERLERGDEIGARLAASQEYEREQRDDLKRYVDLRDKEDLDRAKEHAEEEDKKLKRSVELVIGAEGSLTRQVRDLNADYQSKLGANGSVIADQAAHQRMLSGIVYGTPVSELEGTAFKEQQQAINQMNDAFRNKQTTINEGFEYLFGLNEKINLAQDYTIAYHRILARAAEAHRFGVSCIMHATGKVFEGRIEKASNSFGAMPDLIEGRVVYKNKTVSLWLNAERKSLAKLFAISDFGISIANSDRPGYQGFNRELCTGYSYLFENDPVLGFDLGQGAWEVPSDKISFRMGGLVFFSGLTAFYQEELDALDAEFRAKGLRV